MTRQMPRGEPVPSDNDGLKRKTRTMTQPT
jgi:hypothetical protein